MSTIQKLRSAVYTRKSSEEGLDQASIRSMPSVRLVSPSSARGPALTLNVLLSFAQFER
jgi:hypothetical protein